MGGVQRCGAGKTGIVHDAAVTSSRRRRASFLKLLPASADKAGECHDPEGSCSGARQVSQFMPDDFPAAVFAKKHPDQ